MSKRQTFLLTILTPDNEDDCFCGRVKVIATGKTLNFTNLDELYQLITREMNGHAHQPPVHLEVSQPANGEGASNGCSAD